MEPTCTAQPQYKCLIITIFLPHSGSFPDTKVEACWEPALLLLRCLLINRQLWLQSSIWANLVNACFACEGTGYFLVYFLGSIGASIYTCSGVCLWLFGLANTFLAFICVLNHQSSHIFISPFCFRSVCKRNKCQGSEIGKLEKETGTRKMSPPQYVTFPRLIRSAIAGCYHSQSNLILLPWMTCVEVLNWNLKSSQKWCVYHSLCLYSIKAYGVMETSRN